MRAGALVGLMVALWLFAPGAEAPGAKRKSCSPRGWTTVIANEKVRVFWRENEDYEGRYYGCVVRTGKRTFLTESYGSQYASGGPRFFRLRGTLVAFADNDTWQTGCQTSARTIDLRTGVRRVSYSSEPQECQTTVALVLARGGSLGVIVSPGSYYSPGGKPIYTVASVTTDGTAELDTGEDVDPYSLATGGPWLYWTRGGEPRSARLR